LIINRIVRNHQNLVQIWDTIIVTIHLNRNQIKAIHKTIEIEDNRKTYFNKINTKNMSERVVEANIKLSENPYDIESWNGLN
jgi:hypothetical protein